MAATLFGQASTTIHAITMPGLQQEGATVDMMSCQHIARGAACCAIVQESCSQ